jgi:hypothetical protein
VLVSGNFDEAAKQFHSVAIDDKAPPPLRHWSYLHEGLAHLFAARLTEARTAFDALRDLGAPSGDNAKLGKFFGALADQARSPEAVPAAETSQFDRETTGALAMLVLGMKNWELGDFDQAAALIRNFNSTRPNNDFAWISEYKPLVSNHVADLTEYRGAMEMAKGAKDPATTKAALEVLAKTRAGLSFKEKLGPKIDSEIAALRQRASTAEEEKARAVAGEKGTFEKAVSQANELAEKWQFDTARKASSKLS